jgi:PAS domain S-box-containing protein
MPKSIQVSQSENRINSTERLSVNWAKDDPIPIDDQSLFFRQIVDSSPVLLHTARPDGYLDFFNQTWLHFAGVPLKSLLGWGWTCCIHPDDVEAVVQTMRESFAEGKPFEDTSRVRRADGVYRWMLHFSVPVFNRVGNLIKWSGSSIDIDDRKRAEEQLIKGAQVSQRSEFYLAEAQRLGHIGSWVFDPATGFEHWSNELFQIHGLDPAKGPPNSEQYLALVHPEDREFMASMMKRMLSDNSGFDVTKRIVRAGGEVRYVRCVGTAVSDDAASRRIGVGIDVTENENLTQELRRREAHLAEAQRLSQTGSFGWKPNGEEFVSSEETYRILEYEPAEKLTLDKIIERTHPEDRTLVRETAERASRTGGAIDFTHRLLFSDGRVKHLHVRATPLLTACHELEFAGAVTDITERITAGDERKRAEDHLHETHIKLAKASRLATVAELAASIAHQLNQPLTSILANAQAAKRWWNAATPNVTEVNSSIERVMRDARAAAETMQHIRALFKQESFDKKNVNISDILCEVVRVVQEDPKKRDVPIECHFEESLPVVRVDQIQIQQVFINLIANAIEALEGQEGAPLVVLRATTDSNGMLVQVMDNGPGVDFPDQIFDAFMTTKEKGMGIGLAVSRSIVEAHGGRLWAENDPDGGARFNVTLPLSPMNGDSSRTNESGGFRI